MATVEPMSAWSETRLHAAARANDIAATEDALRTGAEVDATDVLGFTALHVAACEGDSALLARLLAAGAAVDARAPGGELTPLMLAAARGRIGAVSTLLAAGAHANAEGSPGLLYGMVAFAARGRSLPVLERLVAAGFVPRPQEATTYFRLVLELLGHGVRLVERGCSRGVSGESADRWLVDRPLTVPASLMAPLLAINPSLDSACAQGLSGAGRFHPAPMADFEASPELYAGSKDLEPRRRDEPMIEAAHEVRCGRREATKPGDGGGWSPLAMAITQRNAGAVLALVRSAGLDPAALASESDEEAASRSDSRGIYPVHLTPLREQLRRALSEEPPPAASLPG